MLYGNATNMSLGVSAVNPPDTTISNRPPTESDYVIYDLNHLWFVKYDTGVIPYEVYYLASKEGLRASWIKLYPQGGGGSLTTVTDDAKTEEPDVNNRLYLLGGNDPGYPAVYSNIETRKENDNSVVTFLTTSVYQPTTEEDGSAGVYSLGSADNIVDDRFLHGYGTYSTFCGLGAGPLGVGCGQPLVCTGIGYKALSVMGTEEHHTAVGAQSMTSATGGDGCTCLGCYSGFNLVDGSSDILIGFNAGTNYTANESCNIIIGNCDVNADNKVIRLGFNAGNTVDTYIQGIYDSTEGAAAKVVVCGSEGKLSTKNIPATGATDFITNDGTAIVNVDEVQILGADNINTSSLPDGTTNVVTVHLDKSILQPMTAIAPAPVGIYALGTTDYITDRFMHAYGLSSTYLGYQAGPIAGPGGVSCVGIGNNALDAAAGASNNVAIGWNSMTNATTSSGCVCVGRNSGLALTTGSNSLFLGVNSGSTTTTGGSNICFNTDASSATVSNELRIGSATGTGAKELNTAFICGIYQKLPPQHKNLVLIDSDNQLGSIEMGADGEVLTSHGPGSEPTWETSASGAYSTGTFVPNFQAYNGAIYSDLTGVTYDIKTGSWVKIGKLVSYTLTLSITNIGTPPGASLVVTNMPFAAGAESVGSLGIKNAYVDSMAGSTTTRIKSGSQVLEFMALRVYSTGRATNSHLNMQTTWIWQGASSPSPTYPIVFVATGTYLTA